MSKQMINLRFSIKDAFELIPKLSKRIIEESPKAAEISKEMQGTNFSFVADIEGTQYGLTIKDGKDISISDKPIEKPMVKVTSSIHDLEKFISIKSFDAMFQDGNSINKAKYNTIASVNGTISFEFLNDDESVSNIKITFNGAESPLSKIKIKSSDLRALITKEQNPINLFMSGGIALEGDMSLPMALQPLMS